MMPYRETRRELLVFLALVILHVLLISIQVPGVGRKSLLESGAFKAFAPVQKAVARQLQRPAAGMQACGKIKKGRAGPLVW